MGKREQGRVRVRRQTDPCVILHEGDARGSARGARKAVRLARPARLGAQAAARVEPVEEG